MATSYLDASSVADNFSLSEKLILLPVEGEESTFQSVSVFPPASLFEDEVCYDFTIEIMMGSISMIVHGESCGVTAMEAMQNFIDAVTEIQK